jgi:hypothetical protein
MDLDDEGTTTLVALAAAWVINVAVAGALIYAQPLYDKTPYHTSALTGEAWVQELLTGHPERIRNELGVHKEVFEELIRSLRNGDKAPPDISLSKRSLPYFSTHV